MHKKDQLQACKSVACSYIGGTTTRIEYRQTDHKQKNFTILGTLIVPGPEMINSFFIEFSTKTSICDTMLKQFKHDANLIPALQVAIFINN